jgi:hypothetical protein
MRKINKTVLAVAFLFGLEIAMAIQVRELDRELGQLIEANRHRQEFETLTPVCGNPDLVLTRTSE